MKRVRRVLRGLKGVLLLGLVGVFGYVLYHARDLPPQDLSRFERERLEIDPDENAYEAYLLAIEALDWPARRDTDEEVDIREVKSFFARRDILHTTTPATPEERDRILRMTEVLLARNEEALRHVREGLRRPHYQAPPPGSLLDESANEGHVAFKMQTLGNLLLIHAGYLHQTGQHAALGDAWDDACHFISHVLGDSSGLPAVLIGFSLLRAAMPGFRDLARDPETPPETLDKLAHALARIRPLPPILLRGYQSEVLQHAKMIYAFASKFKSQEELEEGSSIQQTLFNLIPSYVFPPNRVISWYVEDYELLAESVHLPYVEVDFDRLSEAVDARYCQGMSPLTPYVVGRILYSLSVGPLHRAMESRCWAEVQVEGARLVVGIQRYRRAHGTLPPNLDALVPDFLDTVTIDPYDGKPFRYDPERAIVYAVGTNGVDHGGDTTAEYDPKHDRDVPYEDGRDVVFRIFPLDPASLPLRRESDTPQDNGIPQEPGDADTDSGDNDTQSGRPTDTPDAETSDPDDGE